MTRAETVAREIADRYPEMMPAWRASLTRQITTALVAFGREAEARLAAWLRHHTGCKASGQYHESAIHRDCDCGLTSTFHSTPPGAPDAHAMSAGTDPEEEAIERAHDEVRRHAGEDSPYA